MSKSNAEGAPTVRVCPLGHRSEYAAGKYIPPFCEHIYTAVFRTIRCNGWGQGRSADRMQIMCMRDTVNGRPNRHRMGIPRAAAPKARGVSDATQLGPVSQRDYSTKQPPAGPQPLPPKV